MQKSKDEMIDWVWRLVKSYGNEGESNLFYSKISFLSEAPVYASEILLEIENSRIRKPMYCPQPRILYSRSPENAVMVQWSSSLLRGIFLYFFKFPWKRTHVRSTNQITSVHVDHCERSRSH
jgi:hypothetical protein